MATLADSNVDLVFMCELDEEHHHRATVPQGWSKVGLGEFQLLLAPGWKVGDRSLLAVWPDKPADDSRSAWRVYMQAGSAAAAAGGSRGSSRGSGSRQQAGSGGSHSRQVASHPTAL